MDSNVPSKYNDLCERMLRVLIRNIIIIVVTILSSYIIFGAGTIYVIIFEGKRATFLGTELPFIDIDTDMGYAINMSFQSLMIIVAIIGNLSIEITACFAYNAIETVPYLFHLESEQIADELKSNAMSLRAKLRVRNILMQIQDLNM